MSEEGKKWQQVYWHTSKEISAVVLVLLECGGRVNTFPGRGIREPENWNGRRRRFNFLKLFCRSLPPAAFKWHFDMSERWRNTLGRGERGEEWKRTKNGKWRMIETGRRPGGKEAAVNRRGTAQAAENQPQVMELIADFVLERREKKGWEKKWDPSSFPVPISGKTGKFRKDVGIPVGEQKEPNCMSRRVTVAIQGENKMKTCLPPVKTRDSYSTPRKSQLEKKGGSIFDLWRDTAMIFDPLRLLKNNKRRVIPINSISKEPAPGGKWAFRFQLIKQCLPPLNGRPFMDQTALVSLSYQRDQKYHKKGRGTAKQMTQNS